MNTTSIIREKKERLDLLEQLFATLDREEKYVNEKIEWFDTDEPRLNDDGTIKIREDGSTVYKQDYKTGIKSDDELSENDKIRLTAIQTIRNQLEKMI